MRKAGIELDFDEPAPWVKPKAYTPPEPPAEPSLWIYDPDNLLREIHKLAPPEGNGDMINNLPTEDRLRLTILQQILDDPRGHWRPLLFGTSSMAERVRAVGKIAPHFSEFIELVARAVNLSAITLTPLRLPPILLVGSPGIGKTYMAKQLAKALETDVYEIAMNIVDSFRLRGLNPSWKGAKIGRIAAALLESRTASPIILIDEFDKPARINYYENPHDVFHTLLEEENAKAFGDDYLEFPLRADKIIWIASANKISDLAPSIVDRLLVLNVPDPSREHLGAIIDNIYALANARYTNAFSPTLPTDVRDYLMQYNPRRISRLLDISFARAASDHRLALRQADVINSEQLIAGETHALIGFLAR